MNIDGREFLLADVTRGMGQIGTFRFSANPASLTDVFYVENEPIISIVKQNKTDAYANKIITQISGAEKCSENLKLRLSVVGENYFVDNQGLARSIMPALELLPQGLYAVHESKMIQSDGAEHFFWNSYNVRHEVKGTADRNSSIGEANYSPCFLIPSVHVAAYQPNRAAGQIEKLRMGARLGGVAYHISGMFSVLLDGHHNAMACLVEDIDFRCLVIEPINDVIYDSGDAGVSDDDEHKPKIIALSCPFVNIPLETLPDNTLERFLVSRKYVKPASFTEIKSKLTKSIRTVSKRSFPAVVYEKVVQLPDCGAVEAASDVNCISDGQLEALLEGEVRFEEEYIVSDNYYSSVVSVVNFLRVSDFERFLKFSLSVLKNEELSSVHKYIAEQLLHINHPSIYEYFLGVAEQKQEIDGFVAETSHKYIQVYNEYLERKKHAEETEGNSSKKRKDGMKTVTDGKGINKLAAAVRDIGKIQQK